MLIPGPTNLLLQDFLNTNGCKLMLDFRFVAPMLTIQACLLVVQGCMSSATVQPPPHKPLTVIAIGDAGNEGQYLRGAARLVNDMHATRHDGGKPDVLLFLGDNFYPIGLNGGTREAESLVRSILHPFRPTLEALGRGNVHAIAGNHDYYARNVIEESLLFGLINITAGPVGISDRGNLRSRQIPWWTYHSGMPAEVTYPLSEGAQDSVQLILFDSALPLRTDPTTWRPVLDSLGRLLERSATRPGIVWRVLAQHHPWFSLGPHGGYSVWDDETETVTYLSNCDRDSNAVKWFLNSLDPEDLCTEKYQQFLDSSRSVIHCSRVTIHVVLSAHDHSLQLLALPYMPTPCDGCPKFQIISGAGSDPKIVRFPEPPRAFTSSRASEKGRSRAGFAQLMFGPDSLRVVFFDVGGEMIDMGGGATHFWIHRDGRLTYRTSTEQR